MAGPGSRQGRLPAGDRDNGAMAVPPRAALRWLIPAVAAGVACGLLDVAVVLTGDRVDPPALTAGFGLLLGWSFVGTGLFAWWRRPGNRTAG